MSHYCRKGLCLNLTPDGKDYCPEHELIYFPQPNVTEYMQGLAPLADSLSKLMEGSKLNAHELSTLAYIQGYLQAAESHLKQPGEI